MGLPGPKSVNTVWAHTHSGLLPDTTCGGAISRAHSGSAHDTDCAPSPPRAWYAVLNGAQCSTDSYGNENGVLVHSTKTTALVLEPDERPAKKSHMDEEQWGRGRRGSDPGREEKRKPASLEQGSLPQDRDTEQGPVVEAAKVLGLG